MCWHMDFIGCAAMSTWSTVRILLRDGFTCVRSNRKDLQFQISTCQKNKQQFKQYHSAVCFADSDMCYTTPLMGYKCQLVKPAKGGEIFALVVVLLVTAFSLIWVNNLKRRPLTWIVALTHLNLLTFLPSYLLTFFWRPWLWIGRGQIPAVCGMCID